MKYYFFNYGSASEGYTVIFDCWKEFYPQELSREIKEFHTYNEQRRKSIFICPNLSGRSSEGLKERLSDVFNKSPDDIILLPFDEKGLLPTDSEVSISELLEFGVLNIIKSRNAVLESDDSFHYVLPSEKHSPFFIRAGNMLSNSEEVNFLALAILGFIKDNRINQIACDTSSILALPYAINYLLAFFGKELNVPINSFGSYASVDEYDFQSRTLVIISASNSGRLLKKIAAKQRDVYFITVVYNGEQPFGNSLINLTPHFRDIVNLTQSKQFDSLRDCEYCKKNSIPVVVRGDQFIPSRILIQKILLSKPHVPSWTKLTVDNLIFSRSISAYKRENLKAKRREIFIDIEKVFKDSSSFANQFNKCIRNNIPASTSIILHLEDKSSLFIARQIEAYLKKIGATAKVISQKQIRKEIDKDLEYVILVVASCVTTGNKLNSISRDLRDFNKSSIHYFTLINRLSDAHRFEVLKKNLEYRSPNDFNINRLTVIFDCHLGDYHSDLSNEADKPSWDSELHFWRQIVGQNSHTFIEERIAILEGNDGLVDNLFLPKPVKDLDQILTLRKNFAFHYIKEKDILKLTQADLYFIVAAVFHYLRNPNNIKVDNKSTNEKYLVQHEHVKTIIDPVTFKRYNDGILQAAILRIANNSELNYAVSDRDSLEMLETLKDIFKDPEDTNLSEALLEFLLFIAIGKLKLKLYHLSDLVNFLGEKYSTNSLATILISVCKEKTKIISEGNSGSL